MTTLNEYETECAICGHECEVAEVNSTNQLGPSDLDLRPAEMARSTIPWWIQACPSCGYCSDEIGSAQDGTRAIVKGDEYQGHREATANMHPLAQAFRLAAYISKQLDDLIGAFHFTLSEAWIHDDLGDEALAMSARLVAANLLKQIHDRGEQAIEDEGADTVIEIDLLRRAGKFARAAERCQRALTEHREDTIKEIVVFQNNLCEQKDRGCYTIGEVFEGDEQ